MFLSVIRSTAATSLLSEGRTQRSGDLEGIILDNGKEIELRGLFIEIGFIPSTSLVEELGIELDKGQIKVDKEQRTNIPGLFAAGDITNCPLKQIVVACGQGAVAAYSAYRELITNK